MRISDWSSDVCSSDLGGLRRRCGARPWQGKAPPAAPHGRSQGLSLLSPFPNCSQVNQPLPLSSQSDPPYLKGLNAPQRQAVLTTEGPVLMLAGAGTGKTAALTARLAHPIASRRPWPSEVLDVTFTNMAARHHRTRVERLTAHPP